MRVVKLLYGLSMAMLVVGCQSPNGSQSTSPTSSPATVPYEAFRGPQADAKFFPAEMKAASSSFGNQLASRCRDSSQMAAIESCFRQRIAEAFDVPSVGKDACNDVSDLKQYSECIGIGTMAGQLRLKITPRNRPEMTPNDWRTPNAYLKAVTKGVILDITDTCLSGDLANVEQCARKEFARVTDISDHFMATCNSRTDTSEYGNCIGEAMAVQMLQKAADRLGARSAGLSRQPALQVAQRAL